MKRNPVGLGRMWIRMDVLERLVSYSDLIKADSLGDAVEHLLQVAQEAELHATQ